MRNIVPPAKMRKTRDGKISEVGLNLVNTREEMDNELKRLRAIDNEGKVKLKDIICRNDMPEAGTERLL